MIDRFITVAVGDVHGCYSQLVELVEEVKKKYTVGKWVFVGDYIDRGPDSKSVLDYLMGWQSSGNDQVICLMGNHEDMMIPETVNHSYWDQNGGNTTLYSFGADNIHRIPEEYLEWVRNLPLYHDDGIRFFVHAGVDQKPPQKSSRRTMLWTRHPFLSTSKDWGRLIIHGHTPGFKVASTPFRVNIDTGCIFEGKLTAAVFNDVESHPIEYLQVKGPSQGELDKLKDEMFEAYKKRLEESKKRMAG